MLRVTRSVLNLNGQGLRILILALVLVQTCLLVMMYTTELLPNPINVVNVESIRIYWTGGGDDEYQGNIIRLKEQQMEEFFVDVARLSCFKNGSDVEKSKILKRCVCINGYTGQDCGIPKEILMAMNGEESVDAGSFIQRVHPRRIIAAMPINHEFDLFEVRINMHYSTVDIFIVQESNFTNSGESKPLSLKEKLSSGWLSEFQDKILYIERTTLPSTGFM